MTQPIAKILIAKSQGQKSDVDESYKVLQIEIYKQY